MTSTHLKNTDPQNIELTVLSGPDSGMTETFAFDSSVGVGRAADNAFVLTDGFVSNHHGEIVWEDDNFIYRDLKSRHGSLVLVDDVSLELQDAAAAQSVNLDEGAEVRVGCTLIHVDFVPTKADRPHAQPAVDDPAGPTDEMITKQVESSDGGRQTMMTTAMSGVKAIPPDLATSDDRLAILFRLAGELNSQTTLDDILDLITEAVFEAFPAANFFAITLADDSDAVEEASPFAARVRGDLVDGAGEDEEPIVSTSMIRQVIETQESILFVNDSLGDDVSQSILDADITAALCAPLIGQRSLLGVMQVDTRGRGSLFSSQDLNLFSVFASNVAFALERARLSDNIVEMFESFVEASVNAIEARDPSTAGHSERVAEYTLALAEAVNDTSAGSLRDMHLSSAQLKELRYAALLHDFGKIAVRESVIQKAKRLPELHLDMIAERFEAIKALNFERRIRRQLRKEAAPIDAARFEDIEVRHHKFCAELDDAIHWLFEVAAAPALDAATIERVEQLGGRRYVSATGQTRPFLTDREVDNLTIEKGTLNDREWKNMRSHARRSQEYLERIPWSGQLENVPCIAGAHHEKLDGTGYPAGLDADQIIPQVRMLTIADIFDALTAADRPYRKAADVPRAVDILGEEAAANKLDENLVELFVDTVVPTIVDHIPG